jgi:putative hydrolase of the HAD superfamily
MDSKRGGFSMLLTDFDALTFDCYGTLIDWESGMVEALKGLTDRVQRTLTRDQILEAHARHESSQQRYTPAKRYRELLPIVYKRLAEEWGIRVTHAECTEYGRSVANWPVFEDSPGALQYLKKYFKLVILSNVDNESFQASNDKLQVHFDAVYTAEDVGSYKPDARNFEYMLEKLDDIGVKKEKVLHTAESMFHDHKPANDFGLKSCWIYRRHAQQGFGATMNPGQLPRVDFKFTSMHELVKAHQEQLRVK